MKKNLYPMEGQKKVICGAKTRSGTPCKNRAMENGRCRFHGGKSLSGKQHGRYKHGYYTKDAKAKRRRLAVLMRECRELIQQVR